MKFLILQIMLDSPNLTLAFKSKQNKSMGLKDPLNIFSMKQTESGTKFMITKIRTAL